MKKFIFLFFVFLTHPLTPSLFEGGGMVAHADRLEKARVIKMDKVHFDTIVVWNDQEWLLQHGRTCTSMSTEWPVQLMLNEQGVVKKIQVNFNESCAVYVSNPSDATIVVEQYLVSDNALVKDHQFITHDQGEKWLLDYDQGCKYLKEFTGKPIYLYRNGSAIRAQKSRLFLPGNRGSCAVQDAKRMTEGGAADRVETIHELSLPNAAALHMPAIQFQAQNNQVYFYWEALPEHSVSHVIYGYSRFPINPDHTPVNQLPNVSRTKKNQLTIKNLANNRAYYFFLAPMGADNRLGVWTVLSATPVRTVSPPQNNPDLDPFEITFREETEESFTFAWPAMKNVRKYRVLFFVDGKRQWMKDIPANETFFTIDKRKEYEKKGLRLEVSTLLLDPLGQKYSDGIYWSYPKKKR